MGLCDFAVHPVGLGLKWKPPKSSKKPHGFELGNSDALGMLWKFRGRFALNRVPPMGLCYFAVDAKGFGLKWTAANWTHL